MARARRFTSKVVSVAPAVTARTPAAPAAPSGWDTPEAKAAIIAAINRDIQASTPPKVDPFFTPEDIISMGEWLRGANDQRAQWVTAFQNANTDTAAGTAQLKQQATKATSDANDNSAARGIFQSSIRDAALYDIEAQRSMQQGLLDSRLKQTTNDYDAWVARYGGTLSNGQKVAATPEDAAATGAPLGTEVAAWRQGWNAKAVGNAEGVSKAWTPPPTPALDALKAAMSRATPATSIKPPAATANVPAIKAAGGVPQAAPAGANPNAQVGYYPHNDTTRLPRPGARRPAGRRFASSR